MCSVSGTPAVQEMGYRLAASIEANPWHIEDLTDQMIYEPSSDEEAVQMTEALLRAGHTLRVGMGLVDARRARSLGFTTADLFAPCTSIGIATDLIEAGFQPTEQGAERTALSRYFTTTSSRSEAQAWAAAVLSIEVPTLEELRSPDTGTPHYRVHAPAAKHSLTWSTANSKTSVAESSTTKPEENPPTPAASTSSSSSTPTPAPKARRRRTPKLRRFTPQSDVTSERLLTTEELQSREEKQ